MNLLAPPPLQPPPDLALPASSVFGRSLAEYTQCFALDVAALRGRDVLDVAAGPSSFVAEACARRVDAVAVDPLYGSPVEELISRLETEPIGRRAPARAGRPGTRVAAAANAERRAAAQRFLDDYATQWLYGRYVGGGLPHLPFFDGTFDLVLCANLLFADDHRSGLDWLVAACRELVRVAADEVRIHPVSGADGRPAPGLARLRRELKALNIASELVTVESDFAPGTSVTLVLRRTPS